MMKLSDYDSWIGREVDIFEVRCLIISTSTDELGRVWINVLNKNVYNNFSTTALMADVFEKHEVFKKTDNVLQLVKK